MRRSLHERRPAAFEADLARTLHNYSVRLSQAGRHDEALKAIEECLAMRRSLHERRPAGFEADLAMTLNIYLLRLSEAGRHEEALKAIEECMAMRPSQAFEHGTDPMINSNKLQRIKERLRRMTSRFTDFPINRNRHPKA
ncbi:hypothetical protein A4X09_0g7765 [Tilletia walkeri]|uniref:Tetratricopeptide repeat protein n=1 Tax=Tilletia walkeri TaxID=117179 RepID=A0A8X7N1B5_9BASI|nr:hypothetical protein A4X09_0g7765 [Tilletia walkeri]